MGGINKPEAAIDYRVVGFGMGKMFIDLSLNPGETLMAKDFTVGQQHIGASEARHIKSTGLCNMDKRPSCLSGSATNEWLQRQATCQLTTLRFVMVVH